MNKTTIIAVITVSLLAAGCGKKANPAAPTPSAAAAVAQPAMTAWQQGDKSTAVSSFVDIDWAKRPLFESGSVLALTEKQFKALSNTERQTKSAELTAQLDALKQLVAAVAQAGRDAAAKGDTAQARKCFSALKQCGAALESPDCLSLVQLVGKAVQRMGDAELAKLGQ